MNKLKLMSSFDEKCKVTAEEFIQDKESGFINEDDGQGYWATETMISKLSCFYVKPDWATHVCWYNN